jgi:hypothetical protein
MSRGRWALLALLAVSGALVPGCGMDAGRGIRGRVIDSSGKGIASAQVSVVPMPSGGIEELARMANSGGSLWGWHFTTNSEGKFRLDGIPTGGTVVAGYTPSRTYTTTTDSSAYGSAYGTGGYASGSASGRSTSRTTVPGEIQYAYEPGEWLGFVVRARGYRPYVTMVNFPSPTGGMDTIRLAELGVGKLETSDQGLRVSLETPTTGDVPGQGGLGKAAPSSERAEGVVRARTIRVPASVLARYRQPAKASAPSWGDGRRSEPTAK